MKNTLKLISLLLACLIMAGCSMNSEINESLLLEDSAQVQQEAIQETENRSSGTFIGDLTFIYGTSSGISAPLGWTKVNVDLNKGAGGKYIYLCYKRSSLPGVTNIAVRSSLNPIANIGVPDGHSNIGVNGQWPGYGTVDLNDGAGGKFIYGFLSTSTSYGLPLTDVSVIYGSQTVPSGWVKVNVDLNEGAGGEYIYFIMKRVSPSIKNVDINDKTSTPVVIKKNETILLDGASTHTENFYVSVQLSDQNSGRYGTEYSAWYTNTGSLSFNNFDVRSFCANKGLTLSTGNYYRVKLATGGGSWKEVVKLIYLATPALTHMDINEYTTNNHHFYTGGSLYVDAESNHTSTFFISVQLSDVYSNRYGTEYSEWYTSPTSYSLINYNLKSFCTRQGLTLAKGSYYRVKVATAGEWHEKIMVIYMC